MKRLGESIKWIWEKIHSVHTAWWLAEIFGWQKVIVSAVVAILLTTKGILDKLPVSLIVAMGLGGFAAVLIVINGVLELLGRWKSLNNERTLTEDKSAAINSVEGMQEGGFEITQWGRTVPFEIPFLEIPEVTVWPTDGRLSPQPIVQTEKDYFTVEISRSEQLGAWTFRARGKLSKVSASTSTNRRY
jgi:hypothetical protein